MISICLGTFAIAFLLMIYSICRVAGDADRWTEQYQARQEMENE